MKYILSFVIILCVYLGNSDLISAQRKDNTQLYIDANKVQFSTELIDEIYCTDHNSKDRYNVILKLRLIYTNNSNIDIILYKGNESSFAGTFISYNEDEANTEKYVTTEQSCSSLPPAEFPIENRPGKDFVVLKPGQIFTRESKVVVFMKKTGVDSYANYLLKPNDYVLQIATSSWPGTDEQEQILAEKWKQLGFLYTFNVKSAPMRFSIIKHPVVVKCSESLYE